MKRHYLNLEERQQIENMLRVGASVEEIADTLKVHIATVYRELKRGSDDPRSFGMPESYSAALGQEAFVASMKARGARKRRESNGLLRQDMDGGCVDSTGQADD